MIGNKIVRFALVVLMCLLVTVPCAEAAKKKKQGKKSSGFWVSARGAVLVNASTGKTLFGKNSHTRVLPASTTKVMTALVVLDKLSLDDYVTVSERATYAQPSKLHLRPGEKYKVRDLLYGILLNSANDASIVLAEAVAGSEWKFVQMMNDRAKRLGAKNTKFANSNGLPSKGTTQYSTAYDMYLIFREALKSEFFRQAITYKYKVIYSQDGRKLGLKSHNKMLFKGWKKGVYGKTGYTRAAKSCFVGYTKKGKETLIIAVFGCTKRWMDIQRMIERYGGVDL
jgi:serine-type D-Ala-D-Ala carboxypeptidase (penicillin-binding protein 5/6)